MTGRADGFGGYCGPPGRMAEVAEGTAGSGSRSFHGRGRRPVGRKRHPALVAEVIDVDGNKSAQDCSFGAPTSALSEEQFLRWGSASCRRSSAGRCNRHSAGYYVSMRLCDPRTFYRQSRELVELSGSWPSWRTPAQTGVRGRMPGGAAALELIASQVPCVKE